MNKNRWKNKTFKQKMKKILSQKAKKRLSIPENNSNWKGGKTIKLRPRLTKKYRNWRSKVFKRDNYVCQKCHKRGGELEAHHIKSWKSYPKIRFRVSNGKTLCYKCHHKKGYKLI
jgi:5-methylcytosine-specific restriction endonuclease McrA